MAARFKVVPPCWRRARYRSRRLALGEGATSLDASPELLAARVGKVAVFPAAQVAVAVGKVEAFPNPLAHAGIEVGREELICRGHLVLDFDQLGGFGRY